MYQTAQSSVRIFWSAVVCAVLLAVGCAAATHAASSDDAAQNTIMLSPASQRMDLSPSDIVKGKLTVVNDSPVDQAIVLYSRPYSVKTESYTPDYQNNAANTDIYQWVRFDTTSYTLKPHESREIFYTIQVPTGAAPGGHYGVVFVETQPEAGSNDAVIRKKRIGTILLANVKGDVHQSGSVLSTDAVFWQTKPPLTVSSRIVSTGNTDVQASISYTVSDIFGATKYQMSNDYVVYPGTVRRVDLAWDQVPWFGLFRTTQTIKLLGKETSSTRFVLIAPRWLPVTLLVVVLIGGAYAWYRHRKTR